MPQLPGLGGGSPSVSPDFVEHVVTRPLPLERLAGRYASAPDESKSDTVDAGPNEDDSLRPVLIAEATRIIGSTDHTQFAGLLLGAKPYALSPELTNALASTVDERAVTIERNLDLVDLPPEGVWIEWRESARHRGRDAASEASHPLRSGVLVCPAPDDPDRLHFISAWRTASGVTQHGYAAAVMSRNVMAVDAWHARTRFSTVPLESQARMLGLAQSYFPSGLLYELRLLAGQESEDNPDVEVDVVFGRAMHRSRMDVISDIPFILGALLLIREGVARREMNGMETLLDIPNPTWADGLAAKVRSLGIDLGGFRRRGRNQTASVAFRPLSGATAQKTA